MTNNSMNNNPRRSKATLETLTTTKITILFDKHGSCVRGHRVPHDCMYFLDNNAWNLFDVQISIHVGLKFLLFANFSELRSKPNCNLVT